jgi:hypothetical protein
LFVVEKEETWTNDESLSARMKIFCKLTRSGACSHQFSDTMSDLIRDSKPRESADTASMSQHSREHTHRAHKDGVDRNERKDTTRHKNEKKDKKKDKKKEKSEEKSSTSTAVGDAVSTSTTSSNSSTPFHGSAMVPVRVTREAAPDDIKQWNELNAKLLTLKSELTAVRSRRDAAKTRCDFARVMVGIATLECC